MKNREHLQSDLDHFKWETVMVESFVVRFVKMFAIEVGFAARLVIKVVFTTYCSSC